MSNSIPSFSLAEDGRQSETAAGIQRGVCGLLLSREFAALTEVTLKSGRRADIMGIGPSGDICIIEIKSSEADYRSDHKWPEYQEFCDTFYFAISPNVPETLIPETTGLIVADAYGAEILREAPLHRLAPARRKAVTLRFARMAARRTLGLDDLPVDFA